MPDCRTSSSSLGPTGRHNMIVSSEVIARVYIIWPRVASTAIETHGKISYGADAADPDHQGHGLDRGAARAAPSDGGAVVCCHARPAAAVLRRRRASHRPVQEGFRNRDPGVLRPAPA